MKIKYEIGEYRLTRDKIKYIGEVPIHYLWYVDKSCSGLIYTSMKAAETAVKERMQADFDTGRQQELFEQGELIIYFTAKYVGSCIYLKMHISGKYDKETLKMVREYDDRIIVKQGRCAIKKV